MPRPFPRTETSVALIDDLEFMPANDMTDLGGATLLVGVRDNDLKGRDSNDLSQLALVHGDPAAQREHCLRNAHEKEPGGSATAVLDCRAFIRERIAQALDGLDATGTPDLAKRTSLPLYLSLRHQRERFAADLLRAHRAGDSRHRGQLHPHVSQPRRDADHRRLGLGGRGQREPGRGDGWATARDRSRPL